ncbi:DUF2294 family protein [Leptolyngbya sp. NK1-12]|uniref:DUF2294 family protein n=1 Tax=Leptolyngbya sp. NK1-12 TaxID=2547451 RepID=A0AA96WUC8_9CYAN|nr:DUF2294 family protein [Leptolyngbya sp. NK1-12]
MTGARYQQLERSLAEQIQAFYAAQLERQPRQVTCRVFANKLVIFLEDGLTYPEQLLLTAGRVELVQQIRAGLSAILQPKLQSLIEQISKVGVAEVLMTTQLETGLVSISAILTQPLEQVEQP